MKKYISFLNQALGSLISAVAAVLAIIYIKQLGFKIAFAVYCSLFVLSCALGAIIVLREIRGTDRDQKVGNKATVLLNSLPSWISIITMISSGLILFGYGLWYDLGHPLDGASRVILFTLGLFFVASGAISLYRKYKTAISS